MGVIGSVAVQGMLGGMPEAADLRHAEVGGQVVVSVGTRVVSSFPAGDSVMRNMAAVTLTELGFTGRRVGAMFGITEQYVSMLRGRTRRDGSAGLIRSQGRPPALGVGQRERARRWRGEGLSDTVIAARLGVHASTVGRALRGVAHPVAVSPVDRAEAVAEVLDLGIARDTPAEDTPAEDVVVSAGDSVVLTGDGDATATAQDAVEGVEVAEGVAEEAPGIDPTGGGGARIGEGRFTSRYAGVMLLHPFLDRVGAAGVLSQACDRSPRRYDDLGVLTATCLSFALGTATVEAGKHLVRAQLGPAAGITALPELRTLRPRLARLAQATDPLGLQRRLAAAMLGADAPGLGLYFVDDHFVPYAGAKPVPKGYNTKRRHAQRGRDDTVVTDYHARAVCFASGDPSGLSVTLPGALAQLREVLGPDAKIMLGFDRGGSYPVVFRACRDAGADWLTWRRGALAPVTAAPVRSFRVGPAGTCEAITLADEMVEINGYGPARQLTLFEHDRPVMQILTSDLTAPAAALLAWLRCRWRIENAFKYLSAHHGIDALADYHADIDPDTTKITNPARVAARKRTGRGPGRPRRRRTRPGPTAGLRPAPHGDQRRDPGRRGPNAALGAPGAFPLTKFRPPADEEQPCPLDSATHMTEPAPQFRPGAAMSLPRMHLNAVLLPDRTVFVSGGALAREDREVAWLESEIYDPARHVADRRHCTRGPPVPLRRVAAARRPGRRRGREPTPLR